MAEHELVLATYLAGDLDPAAARAVDEHLLACDRCWLAVEEDRAGRALGSSLREAADPALADRIRLAVELAPLPQSAPSTRRARGLASHASAAFVAAVAVVLAVLTVVAVWPQRHETVSDPAAVRHVVALARQAPRHVANAAAPTALDAPHTVRIAGQTITVRTYAFERRSALVATSSEPFALPADAQMSRGALMKWTAVRGTMTLYCPRAGVLLAGAAPAGDLAALSRALHLR